MGSGKAKLVRAVERGCSFFVVGASLVFGSLGLFGGGHFPVALGMLVIGLLLWWLGLRGVGKAMDQALERRNKLQPLDTSQWRVALENVWDWSVRAADFPVEPLPIREIWHSPPVGKTTTVHVDSNTVQVEVFPSEVPPFEVKLDDLVKERVSNALAVSSCDAEARVLPIGFRSLVVGGKMRSSSRVQAKRDARKKDYTPLKKRATKVRRKGVTKREHIVNRRYALNRFC